MSTSLEKELHSLYIDGEIPENFVSQYESLVSSDEKEKKALEKMRLIRSFFQEDSGEKTVSPLFAEESFARLQTKMRHAKNVGLSSEREPLIAPLVKYASSFAAAAALFAVIFIPARYNSLSGSKETAVSAISIMKQDSIEPIAQNEVIIDGNIKKESLLSSGLAVSSTSQAASKSEARSVTAQKDAAESSSAESQPVEQKTIYATNLASGHGGRTPFISRPNVSKQFRQRLTSVDPFIPNFSSSSITISVPNLREIGNNIEMMKIQDEPGKE